MKQDRSHNNAILTSDKTRNIHYKIYTGNITITGVAL